MSKDIRLWSRILSGIKALFFKFYDSGMDYLDIDLCPSRTTGIDLCSGCTITVFLICTFTGLPDPFLLKENFFWALFPLYMSRYRAA